MRVGEIAGGAWIWCLAHTITAICLLVSILHSFRIGSLGIAHKKTVDSLKPSTVDRSVTLTSVSSS